MGSLAIERGWAHQKKLIDLLEEMSKDAVSIYMLGDMFDFWMEYFIRDKGKRQYQPFCRELHRLTKKGIHVHFFTGNHDMWTFGGLAQMTGAEIHYEPCTIQRYGKSLFLAHGDGLLPDNWETLYPLPVQKKIRRFMSRTLVPTRAKTKKNSCCLPKTRKGRATTAITISSATGISNWTYR